MFAVLTTNFEGAAIDFCYIKRGEAGFGNTHGGAEAGG